MYSIAVADATLIEDLLRLARLLRRHAHPTRRSEMTPEQVWLLRELGRHGAMRVADLANALGISPSSATVACQRLERVGLVTRRRQDVDERVVLVDLTPEGHARLDAWRQRRRDEAARLLAALDPLERGHLHALIGKILANDPELHAVRD